MALAVLAGSIPAPAAAQDEGSVEPALSESNGCGLPRTFPPVVSNTGGLSNSEPIRGPFGAMFGRTIGQVRSALTSWTVPMSGGRRVAVHSQVLPALEQVAANLEVARQAGHWYPVNSASGYSARTVAGKYSTSYHAVGAAVDINPAANPYREDNVLITDMPAWYVDAWAGAGFCWGGRWVEKKDPMHLSWMGPSATTGYGSLPAPYAPLAPRAPFPYVSLSKAVLFGASNPDSTYHLADASGDGAVDALRLRPHPGGGVLEVAGSWADYTMCGFDRWYVPGAPAGRPAIFGDVGASGRPDLVFLDPSGGALSLRIFWAASGYQQATDLQTGVTPDPTAGHLLADHDRDGRADLWVLRPNSGGTFLEIWDAASGFTLAEAAVQLPLAAERFISGDRDVDGLPDLYAISGASLSVLTAASGFAVAETVTLPINVTSAHGATIADYDGEGNGDLVLFDQAGNLSVILGNQAIFSSIDSWFHNPLLECPSDLPVYLHRGSFADDDDSAFETAIEWMATSGITRSCNPPFNDRFCPRLSVTRGQLATFLARGLSLPPAGTDFFTDDAGSAYEDDINRLAAAGFTQGCDAGRFCPDQAVSRQETATLLVRAYRLLPATGNPFLDVAGVHAADVAALAAAGITTGCSLDGTLFCPFDQVSREQAAALIYRANSVSS
jgi:hypothetical protein